MCTEYAVQRVLSVRYTIVFLLEVLNMYKRHKTLKMRAKNSHAWAPLNTMTTTDYVKLISNKPAKINSCFARCILK